MRVHRVSQCPPNSDLAGLFNIQEVVHLFNLGSRRRPANFYFAFATINVPVLKACTPKKTVTIIQLEQQSVDDNRNH